MNRHDLTAQARIVARSLRDGLRDARAVGTPAVAPAPVADSAPVPDPEVTRWPEPGERDAIAAMTVKEWLRFHQGHVAFEQVTYRGVQALKFPLDTWVYQEIIHRTEPTTIIEIGSNAGGSTLMYADQLDARGGPGRIISVDIDRDRYVVSHDRIVEVTGDSRTEETAAAVRALIVGERVMVIHDGSHEEADVYADLGHYGAMVTPGCYLIVEDGIVDWDPGIGRWSENRGGPLAASTRYLAEHPEFTIDPSCERYLMTYNPDGFLLRS
jgi:cephalosporin hydroxylase